MKTDFIILQVVQKVLKDHGLVFRRRSVDDKGKHFIERFVAYAITSIRKVLMQNLKRNAQSDKDSNGKRIKKKVITFDPRVHIKKENDPEPMNLEIVQPTNVEFDASTITTEKSKDELRVYVKEIVVNYYRKSGIKVGTDEEFDVMWKNEVEKEEEVTQTPMPELSVGNQVRFEPVFVQMFRSNNTNPFFLTTTCNKVIMEPTIPIESEDEYDGVENCGGCEMVLESCTTHNKASLENAFGTRMKCVGVGCGKPLLQCLNAGNHATRGAYVCKNCSNNECRQMKCTTCYFQDDQGGRGTRSSRRNIQ